MGSPDVWLDENLWKWFEGYTTPSFTKFDSAVYRFKVKITQELILEEAERKNIKHIYAYYEALCVIRELILLGELDLIHNGILCYFNLENNETLYRLKVWHDPLGQLKIDARVVLLDDERNINGGVCFDIQ